MNDNFQKAYETQLQHSDEWLRAIRAQNFKKFLEQGIPTKRLEEWKYTDVTSIAEKDYQLRPIIPEISNIFSYGWSECYNVFFQNGSYVNNITNLPAGVIVTNFTEAMKKYPEKIKPYIEKNSGAAFTLLNTALLQDGIFLYIPKKITLDKPIHLMFFTDTNSREMFHLRNLIFIDEQATATIIESYIGRSEQEYFNNTITELYAQENSKINYFKSQKEGSNATHISRITIQQKANSVVKTHSFSFGSKLAREDLQISLEEKSAECSLYGLYLTNNQQHIDHHTRIDHLAPHCSSFELYKGILSDKSRAVFNGKVIVNRIAQQTQTQQVNQNILLSKFAEVNTKPELEIYADNVKCTHGATVGQLDEKALFYLRSRGIETKKAVQILNFAFAEEVIEIIKDPNIRDYIYSELRRKLLLVESI